MLDITFLRQLPLSALKLYYARYMHIMSPSERTAIMQIICQKAAERDLVFWGFAAVIMITIIISVRLVL